MTPPFLIWSTHYREGYCRVLAPEGVSKEYDISFGRPILHRWPGDVACRMDPKFPKDIELADSIYNLAPSAPLVSPRLKALAQEAGDGGIEWLPVRIINHKERTAAEDYHYLHPVGLVDCVDLEASRADFDDDEDEFDSCKGLVLRAEAVPEALQVFRPRYQPNLILVRAALARAMQDAGMSGPWLRDPASYTGLF